MLAAPHERKPSVIRSVIASAPDGIERVVAVNVAGSKLERALGLPVLGAITQTITDSGRQLRAKRLKYFYAGSAALGGIFVLLLVVEFIQRGMVA